MWGANVFQGIPGSLFMLLDTRGLSSTWILQVLIAIACDERKCTFFALLNSVKIGGKAAAGGQPLWFMYPPSYPMCRPVLSMVLNEVRPNWWLKWRERKLYLKRSQNVCSSKTTRKTCLPVQMTSKSYRIIMLHERTTFQRTRYCFKGPWSPVVCPHDVFQKTAVQNNWMGQNCTGKFGEGSRFGDPAGVRVRETGTWVYMRQMSCSCKSLRSIGLVWQW